MMLPEGEEQMDQSTFSDLEYQGKKRQTRREIFLERMDELIPWQRLGWRSASVPTTPRRAEDADPTNCR